MPEKRLPELVDKLHEELAGTDSLPERDRERLRALTDDIDALLGEDEAASRQREAILAAMRIDNKDEVARVLGEIVDTLAKLGI